MKTIKEQFIDKWSTWFMFNKEAELLKKGMAKELEKVIAEHDQEIIKMIEMIDEKIEEYKKNQKKLISYSNDGVISGYQILALIELKKKLEQK